MYENAIFLELMRRGCETTRETECNWNDGTAEPEIILLAGPDAFAEAMALLGDRDLLWAGPCCSRALALVDPRSVSMATPLSPNGQ